MQYLTDQDLAGERGCILSDCGAYRIRLWREWDTRLPRLGVCMLTPSDARHNVEDPTDTRIYLGAIELGFGRYDIVNLFPLSSSDPKVLRAHPDPIGPIDIANLVILDVADGASMILCAWGAEKFAAARAAAVLQLLRDSGHGEKLVHLGLNKDGSPKHPLYIAASTRPKLFAPRRTMKPIYLDMATVAEYVSLSEASVQKLVREERFPKPRLLSNKRVAWLTREVEEWAESRPVSDLAPPANTGHSNRRRRPTSTDSAQPSPQAAATAA